MARYGPLWPVMARLLADLCRFMPFSAFHRLKAGSQGKGAAQKVQVTSFSALKCRKGADMTALRGSLAL